MSRVPARPTVRVAVPWAEVVRDYKLYLGMKARRPSTIEGALASLAVFRRWCASESVDPLGANGGALARFAAWLYDHRARATVRNRLINLRNFHQWLYEKGRRGDDPSREIRPPLVRRKAIRPYTEAEVRRLFGAIRRPRDEALLLLCLGTGWRSSEIM